jgi:HEAT repeat protein
LVAILLSSVAFSQEQTPAKDMERQVSELIASMEKSDYAGQAAADKLVEIGKPAVEQLLMALKHPKPRVRYWSAAAAARIGDERAFQPLVSLVKADPNNLVRATALWYLQHYPRKEVWDLAMELLDDPDRSMRGWAIKLLSTKNRKEALPKLKTLTKHADYTTRYDAMVAVVNLLDDEAIELLRTILRTDDHETVRKGALSSLTILKRKPAVILTVLIDGLEDPSEDVREFAAKLLRKGTNQTFHFEASGGREARAAAVKAVRYWY